MSGRFPLDRRAAFSCALAAWLGAAWLGVALLALPSAAARAGEAAPAPAPIREVQSQGAVRVTLEADRRTMPIDGHLRLTLTVDAPAHAVVTLPEISDRLGPFLVASQTAAETSNDGANRAQWRRAYVLEVEDVGLLTLPPLAVGVREQPDQPASARQLQTKPLEITVTSVLPADVDVTQPKDIAPPVELPPAASPWLPWLVAGLLLGLCAVAALLWRRRRRRFGSAGAEPRAAHLLALAELERLERELAAGRFASEEAYVRLATILRRYVLGRFGLSAPTQTTEELLASVERSGGPVAARRQLIGRVLGQCDLVKFARREPDPGHAQTCLREARAFVEQTADEQTADEPAIVLTPAAAGAP